MPTAPLTRAKIRVATGFGIGRIPVAPGTFGSLLGLALAALLVGAGGAWAPAIALLVLVPLGIHCASAAERGLGERDPGPVVIDEVAGQLVALLFLPASPATWVAGFLLFRLFDIWKPWPVRRLESLDGGSGIMADDLVAGLYANLVLQAWTRLLPAGLALP